MEHRVTALLVAYDGTLFKGWQAQPGLPSVQAALEDALGHVLAAPVQVHGASRTDAGVHAEGQVVHLRRRPERDADPAALERDLPQHLPPSIRLLRAARAHPSFHARSTSVAKRYRYRWSWGADRSGFFLGSDAQPAWDKARAALEGLDGLAALPGLSSPSTDRRPAPPLTSWRLDAHESWAELHLEAPAFRKHQVRNVAGHLAAVALGLAAPETLRALAQRTRPWMGATAPSRGLTLVQVLYPAELDPFR